MINTTPLSKYIQAVRAAELSQAKEVKLSIQDARLLSLALAEIMDKMNRDYESMYNALKGSIDSGVVTVSMDGGGFKD
jgi:hypothetical protein